jgi:hypothetical protein
MKIKTFAAIVALILVVSVAIILVVTFAVHREEAEPPAQSIGLALVEIKIEEPRPSILGDRSITIDHGDSVTLNLTVKNKGENITHGDAYAVGIAVITPEGAQYWRLPPEQYLGIDLSPGGTSRHTFIVTNKRELAVRGKFELQGYIRAVATDEEVATSDLVTVEIRYPA